MSNPLQIREMQLMKQGGSTGPKSGAGKALSSQNARKHGLLSSQVVLPSERQADFRRLVEALRADLKPVGTVENLLVDRIAEFYWRLRRVAGIEGEVMERLRGGLQPLRLGAVSVGAGFVQNTGDNALEKLSRYETSLERNMYRALEALPRLQVMRRATEDSFSPAVEESVEGSVQVIAGILTKSKRSAPQISPAAGPVIDISNSSNQMGDGEACCEPSAAALAPTGAESKQEREPESDSLGERTTENIDESEA